MKPDYRSTGFVKPLYADHITVRSTKAYFQINIKHCDNLVKCFRKMLIPRPLNIESQNDVGETRHNTFLKEFYVKRTK